LKPAHTLVGMIKAFLFPRLKSRGPIEAAHVRIAKVDLEEISAAEKPRPH
jgi:hypothetical protein